MSRTDVQSSGVWLLWWAVLGGITAWTVHLLLAWGAVEIACTLAQRENTDVSIIGISVDGFAILASVVPLAVAALSLVSALRIRSRLRAVDESDQPAAVAHRLDRARFMVTLGVGLNVFAVLMIAFGGLAVLWFSPCT